LYGVGTSDPWSYASVLVLLALTTVAATWIPARRATRIPLVETLRGD
jgi:ABC-type lipoprotein release transport system permease subunit